MSITKDIRSYAYNNVSGLTTKAADAVHDLRTQAEKAVNAEAIKAAVEPYVAQAKGYSTTVTERAEELFTTVKNDKRVARLVSTAESVTGVVVETVQERVVKPVQSLTGSGTKPARKAPATKPAVTKPTPKPAATATTRKGSTGKATAGKAPAKKAPAKA
jgi:nitrate/nitrite-specific signal transduction histidine kinase